MKQGRQEDHWLFSPAFPSSCSNPGSQEDIMHSNDSMNGRQARQTLAWPLLAIALLTGCESESVGVTEVNITKLELSLAMFDTPPALASFRVEFEGPKKMPCYKLSDLSVKLDEVPLDDAPFPGGYNDDSGTCRTYAEYSASETPLNDAPSSTVRLTDDSGTLTMTAADMRINRVATLLAPADGRIHLGDTLLVDLHRPNDVYQDLRVAIMTTSGSVVCDWDDVAITQSGGMLSIDVKSAGADPGIVPVNVIIYGEALMPVSRCDAAQCSAKST